MKTTNKTTKPRTYKSEIAATMHEMISGFHEAGVIPQSTMREFDELCLAPIEKLSPSEIKAIREQSHTSQSVFARYLNVSPSVVSQWERGERSPGGAALKLLSVVKKNGLECLL